MVEDDLNKNKIIDTELSKEINEFEFEKNNLYDNFAISSAGESQSFSDNFNSHECHWITPNIVYTGWAEDFVNRINDSSIAQITTFDNKHCLKWRPDAGYGEYDIKYMFKTNWKENTRYRIRYDFYSSNGYVNLVVEYTDDSYSYSSLVTASNTWLSVNFVSSPNKTIKYIRAYWSNGYNYLDLDSIMISEGLNLYDYEPYEGCLYGLELYDTIEPNFITDNYYINCGIISIFLALIILIVNAPFIFIRKVKGN